MAEELTQENYQNSLTKLSNKIELKIIDPSGENTGLRTITVDDSVQAHENKKFMGGFTMMMLAGSGKASFTNDFEVSLLKEAFRRHEVKPSEAVEAFWKAYGDPYVKGGEIKFRHLWKYIEEARTGRDGRLHSYREMLAICDKEGITMEHFERNDELFHEIKQNNPDKRADSLPVWRRL